MRVPLFLTLLIAALIVAGMAFESFFLRLLFLGEVNYGDLFQAVFELCCAAWSVYELVTGKEPT